MDNPLVQPTNNAAERALRDYVIKRKQSYSAVRTGLASDHEDYA